MEHKRVALVSHNPARIGYQHGMSGVGTVRGADPENPRNWIVDGDDGSSSSKLAARLRVLS
jgi:hypothetical protein